MSGGKLSDARRQVLATAAAHGAISGVQLISVSQQFGGRFAGRVKWGSRLLRDLCRLGYVERDGVSVSNRASYFRLTDKGRQYLELNG